MVPQPSETALAAERTATPVPAPAPVRESWLRRLLPPFLGALLLFAAWEAVVFAGIWPDYVLPGPRPVLARLGVELFNGQILAAAAITLRRAAVGYLVAVVVGVVLGLLMARVRALRSAMGAAITGLQTMPSVAWFPLAILLFKLGESAILFVVVLGAAPSVANGLLHAIDHVPPQLIRAGRVLGAKGFALYRHVILPAALPGFVAGLKQGWAFAWRSLMAGELLVIIGNQASIGTRLHFARELSDAEGLLAWMLVVLFLGIGIDVVLFGTLERRIREVRGLGDDSHA